MTDLDLKALIDGTALDGGMSPSFMLWRNGPNSYTASVGGTSVDASDPDFALTQALQIYMRKRAA